MFAKAGLLELVVDGDRQTEQHVARQVLAESTMQQRRVAAHYVGLSRTPSCSHHSCQSLCSKSQGYGKYHISVILTPHVNALRSWWCELTPSYVDLLFLSFRPLYGYLPISNRLA